MAMPGINTQINSEAMTVNPHSEKNAFTPIGDTWIGRKGRKSRSWSKGQYRATPRPPLVMASSKAGDAQATKQMTKIIIGCERS